MWVPSLCVPRAGLYIRKLDAGSVTVGPPLPHRRFFIPICLARIISAQLLDTRRGGRDDGLLLVCVPCRPSSFHLPLVSTSLHPRIRRPRLRTRPVDFGARRARPDPAPRTVLVHLDHTRAPYASRVATSSAHTPTSAHVDTSGSASLARAPRCCRRRYARMGGTMEEYPQVGTRGTGATCESNAQQLTRSTHLEARRGLRGISMVPFSLGAARTYCPHADGALVFTLKDSAIGDVGMGGGCESTRCKQRGSGCVVQTHRRGSGCADGTPEEEGYDWSG
ncbi:hypothetical protein B0H14DRAFT_1567685 [Mycena olivaceomarginata]|nr:hypothetical protein B0H14DRAFT_1567685 [Mycena olivaceomarginata]